MENVYRNPIIIIPKGKCPECLKANLIISQLNVDYFTLDDDGIPHYIDSMIPMYVARCPLCMYKSTNYLPDHKGEFKYVPLWDRREFSSYVESKTELELDIPADSTEERTFDGNPFVES